MIDLETSKVILSKPVRRKTFVLGRSTVLLTKEVAVMDDGAVRIVSVREPNYWFGRPQYVCSKLSASSWDFEKTVQKVREFEADYITTELPETHRP